MRDDLVVGQCAGALSLPRGAASMGDDRPMALMTVSELAERFGVTPEQVRAQYARGTQVLRLMAEKARKSGRKVNGYTANELDIMAQSQANRARS
jgi:transposase-like protein